MKAVGRRAAFVVALSLLLCPLPAIADGFFVGTARQLPAIPQQRAIVAFREGSERLVVESTFDGEKGDYGWIVPVPAVPTRLERVSPGLLDALSLQTEPEFVRLRNDERALIAFFAVLLVPITLLALRGRSSLLTSFGIVLICCLGFILIPNFLNFRMGGAGEGAASGIAELRRELVGNYDTAVLRARSAGDLDAWLRQNGFSPLPADATPIVEEYIRGRWVFVAARLRNDDGGPVTPHPLLVEFPAEQPVYPMRLTALPRRAVRLDLFVAAEGSAAPVAYALKREFSDRMKLLPATPPRVAASSRRFPWEDLSLGHPDAGKVLWDGCVVTRLAGSVPPEQMQREISFRFEKAGPFRLKLYGTREANLAAGWKTMIAYLAWMAVLPFFERGRRLWLLACSLPVFAALFAVFYLPLPKAGGAVLRYTSMEWRDFRDTLRSALIAAAAEADTLKESASVSWVEQRLAENLRGVTNPLTGTKAALRDSPGNVTVAARHGYAAGLLLYGRDGTPKLIPMPGNGYLELLTVEQLVQETAGSAPEVCVAAARELARREATTAIAALGAAAAREDVELNQERSDCVALALAILASGDDRIAALEQMVDGRETEGEIASAARGMLEEIRRSGAGPSVERGQPRSP